MIIAFDCVGPRACCAIRTQDFYKEQTFKNNLSQTVSADLIPALVELARQAGKTLADTTVVATTTGPGSFTGIRLGLATALGLQQATDCTLFTPTTLDVWCFEGWRHTHAPTIAAIDSKRGDYFVQHVDETFKCTNPAHVLSEEELPKTAMTDVPNILEALLAYYDFAKTSGQIITKPEPFYLRTPTFVKQKRYETL